MASPPFQGEEDVNWMLGELRRVLVAHPNVVPLFATRASASPAVARTAEVLVGALRQAGFDDQTTVRAFCALFSYVLGFVVVEAGRPTPASATAEARCRARAEQLATLDPGELLRMATVAPAMAGFVAEKAFASDTQFTYGLKLLVGALERQLAPSGTAYPRSRAGDAG